VNVFLKLSVVCIISVYGAAKIEVGPTIAAGVLISGSPFQIGKSIQSGLKIARP
jgi:hypothetical protein